MGDDLISDVFWPKFMNFILRREFEWNLTNNRNYLTQKKILQSSNNQNTKSYFKKLINLANSYKPKISNLNFSSNQIQGIYSTHFGKINTIDNTNSNSVGSLKRVVTFNKNNPINYNFLKQMPGNSSGGQQNCCGVSGALGCWSPCTQCNGETMASGESCFNGTWYCWGDYGSGSVGVTVSFQNCLTPWSMTNIMQQVGFHCGITSGVDISSSSLPIAETNSYSFSNCYLTLDTASHTWTTSGD